MNVNSTNEILHSVSPAEHIRAVVLQKLMLFVGFKRYLTDTVVLDSYEVDY